MSSIPAAQTDRLRLIQRLFVQVALAEAIGPHSDTGSLDELVASVARRCCENFSEAVVRELIIEGYVCGHGFPVIRGKLH